MPQVVPHSRVPDFQCIDRVVMTALRADEKPAVLLENGDADSHGDLRLGGNPPSPR